MILVPVTYLPQECIDTRFITESRHFVLFKAPRPFTFWQKELEEVKTFELHKVEQKGRTQGRGEGGMEQLTRVF